MITWINWFLTSKTNFVVWDNCLSNPYAICGVPLGLSSVFSFFKYALMTLPLHPLTAFPSLISAPSPMTVQSIVELFPPLIGSLSIQKRCTVLQMLLNTDKCTLISFHRCSNTLFSLSPKRHSLTSCSLYKYLRVHLTCNMSWTTHV